MRPEQSIIATLLDKGKIPVISFHEIGGNIRLSVHDSADVPEYIAISHVWAGGLGNTVENALPLCQSRRIYLYCRNLHMASDHSNIKSLNPGEGLCAPAIMPDHEIFFWMDTLCVPRSRVSSILQASASLPGLVPLNNIEIERLRQKAVQQMSEIYLRASKVLVLDPHLLQIRGNLYEKMVSVSYSNWTRRLWTLQEAIFSQGDLHFQFLDGTKSFMDLFLLEGELGRDDWAPSSLFHISATQPLNSITNILMQAYEVFNMDEVSRLQEVGPHLAQLLNAIARRTTTKKEDEAICIATMLGLPIVDVLNTPGSSRLMQLFRMLAVKLPASILFSSGHRMEEPEFRWAPTSFLGKPHATDAAAQQLGSYNLSSLFPFISASLCERGLLVRLHSWRLVGPPEGSSQGVK